MTFPEDVEALTNTNYILQVHEELGHRGTSALQRLLKSVRNVHKALSTERLARGVTVAVSLDVTPVLVGSAGTDITSEAYLTALHDPGSPLTIQILSSGQLRIWNEAWDLSTRSGFVAYQYRAPYAEVILTPLSDHELPRLVSSPTHFGTPYFLDLAAALDHYDMTCSRQSQCSVLASAWREANRIVFSPSPEHKMRDSLLAFLRMTLRAFPGAEVMPEQNVNATRPVDIKVSWSVSNRIALIEIKWLGKSADVGATSYKQQYFKGRASEGADQLATYLDLYRREAPNMEPRGYLVVFDGRRARTKLTASGAVSGAAWEFRNAALEYSQAYLDRPDTATPIRLFLEPAPL